MSISKLLSRYYCSKMCVCFQSCSVVVSMQITVPLGCTHYTLAWFVATTRKSWKSREIYYYLR